MQVKNIQSQRASTLIEVLVAMTIVAIILMALGSMMAMSVKVARNNEMEQLAILKAQETMEYFRKERSVRGWDNFFKMTDGSDGVEIRRCINVLPASISDISALPETCGEDLVSIDLASFDFQREISITRQVNPADSAQNSIQVEVDIYRGYKSANHDPFLSLKQEFRPY